MNEPESMALEFIKSIVDRGGVVKLVDDRCVITGVDLTPRDVTMLALLRVVAVKHRAAIEAFLNSYQPGGGFLPVPFGEEDPWSAV